jgi:hypothetical protein
MRNWLIVGGLTAAVAAVAFVSRPEPVLALGGEAIEIVGSGKMNHYHGSFALGSKTFVNKITPAGVVKCITGEEPSCAGLVEVDAGGKAYLFFDSATSWRAATNPAGTGATTLTGFVGGKGEFTFTGHHDLSNTDFIFSGKVKFEKGSSVVKSIKGKYQAISTTAEHVGVGSFRSVGKAITISKK